jgi:integral membrane protein
MERNSYTLQVIWLKRFRWISILEGSSFILLIFFAMPLKYIFELPLAVKYIGWAHGVLFVLYILILFPVARILKWSLKKTFFGLIASILPFGPFIFDRNLKNEEKIKGKLG